MCVQNQKLSICFLIENNRYDQWPVAGCGHKRGAGKPLEVYVKNAGLRKGEIQQRAAAPHTTFGSGEQKDLCKN